MSAYGTMPLGRTCVRYWGKSGHQGMSAYDPKRALRTTSVISSLALLTKVTIPCSNALQGLGTSRRSSLSAQWGRVVAVILLVEDEDQVRVLAESFLQTAGHTTLSAGSIEQALALLSSPEPIDLLFIDLNLKGESEAGLSLAVQAVEMRPALKVLYTSGQAVTDGMMALFVKNSAFLPKPYTVEQLGTMLGVKFNFRSSARPHAGDGSDGAKRF